MRLALLLSIITFTSTLWWERLLYSNELLWAFIIFLTLLLIPRLRAMAVIPFIIVYFSLYSSLTLTGKMPFNWANNIKGPHLLPLIYLENSPYFFYLSMS
jgi:hypothetical protein